MKDSELNGHIDSLKINMCESCNKQPCRTCEIAPKFEHVHICRYCVRRTNTFLKLIKKGYVEYTPDGFILSDKVARRLERNNKKT